MTEQKSSVVDTRPTPGRLARRIYAATTAVGFVLLLSACAAGHAKERRDPVQIFESADTNGDGIVTRAEFRASRAASFAKYDRDGDGFIDSRDIPRRLRARQKMSERLDELIDRFDADRDGRISRAEFVDGPTAAFDLADVDRDGQLTRDEVANAARAIKSRRNAAED